MLNSFCKLKFENSCPPLSNKVKWKIKVLLLIDNFTPLCKHANLLFHYTKQDLTWGEARSGRPGVLLGTEGHFKADNLHSVPQSLEAQLSLPQLSEIQTADGSSQTRLKHIHICSITVPQFISIFTLRISMAGSFPSLNCITVPLPCLFSTPSLDMKLLLWLPPTLPHTHLSQIQNVSPIPISSPLIINIHITFLILHDSTSDPQSIF